MNSSVSTTESRTPFQDRTRALLQQRFGTPFRFVECERDGSPREALFPAEAGPTDWPEFWDEGRPQLSDPDNAQRRYLLLPLTGPDGRRWIAAGHRRFLDRRQTLQLGQSVLREIELFGESAKLHEEIDSFAHQLTADFEELTFLRRIPDVMDSSRSLHELIDVVDTVMANMMDLVTAESIVLVTEGADNPFLPGVDQGAHRVGRDLLDDSSAREIVQRHRDAALAAPFIQNRVAEREQIQLEGVHEYILVPINKADHVMGWLIAVNRQTQEHDDWRDSAADWDLIDLEFGTIEATLLGSVAAILATHASNVEHIREKEELLIRMVRVLVSAIEAKDEYTCGHSERVALYGRRLAEALGYSQESCDRLYLTGLLHDIGKIGVQDAILRKPTRLTDEEFAQIKEHPDKGWAILHDLQALKYVLPGVLHHHERVDGLGYPDGLSGDEIPWDGRILAVADAYDAMTSNRPYRHGMPEQDAERILREGAGTQWDADAVDAFFEVLDDIREIRDSYQHKPSPVRQPKRPAVLETALLEPAPQRAAEKAQHE